MLDIIGNIFYQKIRASINNCGAIKLIFKIKRLFFMQCLPCLAGSNINQDPKYSFFSYYVFRLLLKVPMILFFLLEFQHTKYHMIILFSNIISGQIRLNNKFTILVFIGLTLVFLGMEFFGFILFGGHSVCLSLNLGRFLSLFPQIQFQPHILFPLIL